MTTTRVATRPRLGFAGIGWIGRNRLDKIERSGAAEVAGICDPALDGCLGSSQARRVVDSARAADRLLMVDLSYRWTDAARRVRDEVAGGGLGDIYAAELAFHNAYGPDKAWFYDRDLSGGGCVIDLGVHLIDLALWTLGFPRVASIASHLH